MRIINDADGQLSVVGGKLNAELSDATVGAQQIQSTFISHKVLLDDATGNSHGWDPDGTKRSFAIIDNSITADSVVVANVSFGTSTSMTCAVGPVGQVFEGADFYFGLHCAVDSGFDPSIAPPNGAVISYAIISMPTTPVS